MNKLIERNDQYLLTPPPPPPTTTTIPRIENTQLRRINVSRKLNVSNLDRSSSISKAYVHVGVAAERKWPSPGLTESSQIFAVVFHLSWSFHFNVTVRKEGFGSIIITWFLLVPCNLIRNLQQASEDRYTESHCHIAHIHVTTSQWKWPKWTKSDV